MWIKITYIFHNCFVLDVGSSSYVFDVPAEKYRPSKAAEALRNAVSGRDTTIFFTHSHIDHFAPDYAEICSDAASLRSVVSDDIEDMFPEMITGDTLIVEPDEKYEFQGMKIETMLSNDLGVAYLLRTPERLQVYNGGDLASWDWENSSFAERNFTRKFFRAAVSRVASKNPQVTFSNVDRRLENLAGGPQFVDAVRPQVFVPTHAFGRTQWLEGIHEKLGLDESQCFVYRRPGDSACFEIDI
ncbi:hypothetical protein [Maridesulfovibrio sp.]|uniref:MBL fold metallo-hydrolase n=1 Tax=Maridesulfovibrio sp. TaxID=2795000 RepID=UPI002A18A289|nr:hypothetical protein [Maridesulfovibrio sp.]